MMQAQEAQLNLVKVTGAVSDPDYMWVISSYRHDKKILRMSGRSASYQCTTTSFNFWNVWSVLGEIDILQSGVRR